MEPAKKKVKYSAFDREVLARLPLTSDQREELIKHMWAAPPIPQSVSDDFSTITNSQVSVEVVSKPSVGAAPVIDV